MVHADMSPEEFRRSMRDRGETIWSLFARMLGYQGNSSALSHSELDGADRLQVEDIAEWAEEMLLLNSEYGVKILGGCCGTGHAHLLRLVGADHG